MISAILFISFFVFLILGLPIAICLGLSSVCAILYSGTSLTIVATNMYSGISKFLLLAIPFFVLSGNIMAKAGISKRLINFVDTCVGHKKGGIAIVCVIVACFFGAISGSGPATVAALGAVLIPAMVEQGGFSAPFSTALMATSSSIAIVIPPSIAFVVYASITGVSIADMFMAGIVPGLLMGVALVIIVMIEAKKHNIQPSREKASAKERWNTFKDAFWGFLMPVIILGGIYGGIFTPTEAAAVSVVYGLFVGMVIYREVKLKDLFDILVDSAKTTGGIMLIVASASLFSFVCTKFGIANAASELLAGIAHNQFTFLLIVNIIFLIAGCFIDANSAMYIFVPIMLPVCKALGYDVVAFGVMATVNLAIGQVTPPVGVNLFVAISIKIKKGLEVTLQQISRAVMPMIAASVAVLLIITYIPAVSTALPKALAKEGSYTGDQSSDTESQSSKDSGDGSDSFNTIADYSDLDWPEMTWNFACSTTETSTWADGGRKFGELMEKATGGKVKVNIYAADQLTNGNQSEGIQALMNGDPVQISMHSNLIYSAFDPRFNVVSLPFIYDSYDGTTEGSAKVIDELKAGTLKAEDYDRFNEFMDTFDLLSQYNINGEDPLGALYDQDPIFLADGDAALWINGCWAWPNLKEAGASDSDEYGFLPYILGNDTSDFANNGIQASASKQLMIDAEQSTPEQQEAAKAFVNWLVYSDNGQKMLVEDAAVIPACKNNTYEALDPLGKDIQAKMAAGNTYSSSFIAPSDHWSVLGASMQKYLGGQCTRDDLAADIDNYWTSQN